MTALWKDGVLPRLEVEAIGEPAITELLERVLGGRIQSTTARQLFTETAGNMLWLRHLVEGERTGGRLRCVDGVWHRLGGPRLGPALTTLIDERIGSLPEDLRHVLELLALGEPLDVDLLRTLAGESAIEACVDRSLVTVSPDGPHWSARLAHPLYGEAVRTRLSSMRGRRLRGHLVEALRVAGENPDLLRLAVLALDSDLPADPALFLAAANTASLLTDMDLTERLVGAARDAGAGFEAQLLHAFVLSYLYEGERAEAEYAEAGGHARTDAQRLRVAQSRALNLSMVLARPTDAKAVLDEVADCHGARSELLGIRAMFAVAGNRLGEGRASARQALDTPGISAACETFATWALGAAEALEGAADQSTVAARGARAALRSPETILLRINLAWWEVQGLGLAGQVEQTRLAIDRLTSSMGGRFQAFFYPNLDGWLALISGRVGTATALLTEFRPYFPGHGGGWTTMMELRLALALGMGGDLAGVREALRRAEASRHPAIIALDPQFELARAWLAAAEGTTSNAIRHAREAGALAAVSGQSAFEVLARHASVCFGDRGQVDRLGELARRLGTPRAMAAAAHAAAWARQKPSELLASGDMFAEAGLMLQAADAAAQAYALARSRLAPEVMARAAGRIRDFAADCEGARTPALLAAEQPLPISERQREIARMVAAGMSNRDIADRLRVSVRTVEGHIYHACTRLGVSTRTELAQLLGPPSGDRHGRGTGAMTVGAPVSR
ncbi:helix-turn-helix transcriptional regulator [Pseudonocardia yunnanensis]|uniref:LuxR C-terminal-related transcriptional regulator n=1 Tax=Pseudonocardia yunnanensis TaxID=58107 RepID=A0ABW4F630_9PSEU